MLFSQTERRVGKVRLRVVGPMWAEMLAAVQQGCAVIRCEYRAMDECFHMDLLHPDFDPVAIGMKAPHYDVILTTSESGALSVAFEKK